MFETSVVQARAQAARGRLTLLTISVIAHSAVVVGAIAFSITSVEFPITAPDAYEQAPVIASVRIPPLLGTRDGGGAPEPPKQQKQVTPIPAPTELTAPNQISDAPIVPAAQPSNEVAGTLTGGQPGPIGVEDGDPNSISTEVGDPSSVPIPSVEPRIYEPGEVKAPVLLRKVEPTYPTQFLRHGIQAMVAVRCVIDKNGHVRDLQITNPAMAPFNDAVITAVQQWRYTPASLHGVAVDSYLDVTVRFTVKR